MSMRTLFTQIKTVWIFALCAVVATLLTFHIVPAQAQSAGITVSKSTVTVEESGTTNSFTVVLDTQPETSVTLSATNSETTQFSISLSYLTFTNANWNAPQTITLTPTSDDVADGDTSATITFSVLDATSDDTYDNVADVTVAVTVSDNNACDVTVVETNGTTMVTEAATTDTFTVKLASQPTADVVVSVISSDTGEATVDNATLTFTSSNWNTTQTVTVTGVDDALSDDLAFDTPFGQVKIHLQLRLFGYIKIHPDLSAHALHLQHVLTRLQAGELIGAIRSDSGDLEVDPEDVIALERERGHCATANGLTTVIDDAIDTTSGGVVIHDVISNRPPLRDRH